MPYPFKNPVNPTYQEVMGSNIGVPSEDLIDFDKSDKAVNASSRLSEIDAEIARLKQRIAEKRASDRFYNKPASTFDYIISGDRSGLDRIAQQRMTEEQNNLNRANALILSKANDTKQKEANLFNIKKQVSTLLSEKNVLEAQGKPTNQIDSALNVIYEEYPEIKEAFANQPQPEYDPRDNPDYQLAKFSKVNSKNTTVEGIDEAIESLSKYRTPEVARRLAELDMERTLRVKADESGETLKNEIDAFNTSTGDLSDYLTNKKYTVKVTAGGYKLIDPKGNIVKSPKIKNKSSWE